MADAPDALWTALDTSALESLSYNFQGTLLQAFLNNCKSGRIRLLVCEITRLEVEDRIKKRVKEELEPLRKLRVTRSCLSPAVRAATEALNDNAISADIIEQWTRFISDCRGTELSMDGHDLRPVMVAYFSGSPPFGSGGKKGEFRDAFVAQRLRQYANEKEITVHLCTHDSDFKELCDDTQLLRFNGIQALLQRAAFAEKPLTGCSAALERINETLADSFRDRWFELYDEDGDVYDEEATNISILEMDTIDVNGHEYTIAGSAEVTFSANASLADYDSSPRDAGDYVFINKCKRRYHDCKRNVDFTVRVVVDENAAVQPTNVLEVDIVHPIRILVGHSPDDQYDPVDEDDYDRDES